MVFKKRIYLFSVLVEREQMLKLAHRIFMIFLPCAIILGYFESRLREMPTTYSMKRKLMETMGADMQVLVMGSSNAYYGINPQRFDVPSFNQGNRAQSHYYDLQILRKEIKRLSNLKIVVVPFIFLTFGTEQENIELWRTYFYDQYFGISANPKQISYYGWSYWVDPRRWSKIANFAERAPDYIAHNFRDQIADKMNDSGWFDAGPAPMNPSKGIGKSGSEAHNGSVNPDLYDVNLNYLQEMIDKDLKPRNIQVILLQLPLHIDYRKHLNEKYTLMGKKIQDFADKNHLVYKDYSADERFSGEDFTDLPDHLNQLGANKISKIINLDLIRPALANKK